MVWAGVLAQAGRRLGKLGTLRGGSGQPLGPRAERTEPLQAEQKLQTARARVLAAGLDAGVGQLRTPGAALLALVN